ncbi:ATPase SWSAP1-like [Mya arenaria]|uniref:ATPase SWSAP1-like n=1 Tax=Mya arenaria TaxID=6604 RepID=UPI0022E64E65|nr:ATPase SWSAP1-like [Mya arenaria]
MSGLLYCLPLTSTWLQGADPGDKERLDECLTLIRNDTHPLIFLGEHASGKTVLLFQAGVAYASQDLHVTLISRRPLSRMPHSVHGMIRPEAAGNLNTLTFLYMSNVSDLLEYCASVHTRSVTPDILIVDDLDFYLNQLIEPSPEAGCAKLCALLVDTLHFIRQKSPHGALLLGCTPQHKLWSHIFSHFKFTAAELAVLDRPGQLYSVSISTGRVQLSLTYQVKTEGVVMKEVNASKAVS